jgi:hypothetical protein
MALPLLPILGGIGAIGSLFAGKSAANAQKEQMRRQSGLAQQQAQLMQGAIPYYNAMLGSYAQQLGLNVPQAGVGGTAPAATAPQAGGNIFARVAQGGASARPRASILQPSAPVQAGAAAPAAGGPMGSQWGTPQDQLRLQQAEEDIQRMANQRANQLRFQLGGRGVADSTIAAALAQNEQRAGDDYAQFRRGLAIQAPEEQARRFAMFSNFLNPALGAGAAAANIFGQQGAMYGNQAGQAMGNIGNLFQQYAYMDALKNRQQRAAPWEVEYDIWNRY